MVPDALSRLPTVKVEEKLAHFGEIHAYAGSLVKMKPEVRARIIKGYEDDHMWKPIWVKLKAAPQNDQVIAEAKKGSSFQMVEGLIYTTVNKRDGIPRLCLP